MKSRIKVRKNVVRLYSWNLGNSSKELSRSLGVLRIKHNGSRFIARPNDVIINWGSSTLPAALMRSQRVLNKPGLVASCTNKLSFFNKLVEGFPNGTVVPMYWTSKALAQAWLNEKVSRRVVVRAILNGHSGRGITIVQSGQTLPDAPLYVAYIPKQEEYRVHVLLGQVIFVQRKARRHDVPDDRVNWQVRNLDGGFIYQNQGVNPPQCVLDVVLRAHPMTGLDFGAYDVVLTQSQQAYVLEVNTAPGLTGTTLTKYTEGFQHALTDLRSIS